MEKYCRVCHVTGVGMNEGWYFEDLGISTSTEEATLKVLRENYPTYKDLPDKKAIEQAYWDEEVYWTSWWDDVDYDIKEQGYYYTEDGTEVKLPSVLASKFVEWYYSDDDETKIAGEEYVFNIKTNGYFNKTVEEIFDSCGYIPMHICLIDELDEKYDEDHEFSPEELVFINDLKK